MDNELLIQEFQKDANCVLVKDAPDTLQIIAQRANEARLEVSKHGLTRVDQLLKTVSKDELENAEKNNSPDLSDLQSQSCFRKVTTALTNLDKVSKILVQESVAGNASKIYFFEKLVTISNYEMTKGNKFEVFGGNPIYEKLTEEDKAVSSQLSQKIVQTLGSASSLANSIYKAYEYPFILDNMQEQCEEIEKQNLVRQDELGKMTDTLKKLTKKIPESPEARTLEKHLLENIQPTLASISAAAEKTIAVVSANGIGADKSAEPIKELTMKLNNLFKASKVMNEYIEITKDAERTFLLETIGELPRRNLSQDQDLPELTLNSLMSPDICIKLLNEERVAEGKLSQNVIYMAQSATLLADFVKKNYHSPSSLKIIAEELKRIPCDFSSPKELLEQLQKSDLQSKVDKSQLESGKAARSEKTKAMVSSVKEGASKETSSTLFFPVSNTSTAVNEPVTLRKITEESRQIRDKNLTSTSFTRFMAANRESDGMNTSFSLAPTNKKIEEKEEPQKLGPSHR